ncbi:hypothetical protein HDU81_000547 [Chytriomyces hyalinus]|nr:hypothetical protein HDU81_000547 [Chytriomyces hyalinus]
MSLDWPALIQLLDTKFRHQSDEMVALHHRIGNLEMECTRKDVEIVRLKEALKEAIQQQYLPPTSHVQSATPPALHSQQMTQSATAPNIPTQQAQQQFITVASMMIDRLALGIPSDNFDCHIKSCMKPGSDLEMLTAHLSAKHCGATLQFPTGSQYIARCEKGKLKCPKCDASYTYAGKLKTHYVENHSSNVDPDVSVSSEQFPLELIQNERLGPELSLDPNEYSACSTSPIKAQIPISKDPPAEHQNLQNHQSKGETPHQNQTPVVQAVYRNAPVLLKEREHLGIPVTNNRCHLFPCVVECTSRKALYHHLWNRHADGILVIGPEKQKVSVVRDAEGFVQCPQCQYKVKFWVTLLQHVKVCDEKHMSRRTPPLVVPTESAVEEAVQSLVDDGKAQDVEAKRPRPRSPLSDVSFAKRHKLDEQGVDLKASVSTSILAASTEAGGTIEEKEDKPSTIQSTSKVSLENTAEVDPNPPHEAPKIAIPTITKSFPFKQDDLGDISASEKRTTPSGVFYNT